MTNAGGELALLHLLHLCDSLFPIGSFAYSEGLESAANARLVVDHLDLDDWLEITLIETVGRLDGPGALTAWSLFSREDWSALAVLDAELMAIRPSSAGRTSTASTGLRLLHTWAALAPEPRLTQAVNLAADGKLRPAFPVAFAGACAASGIGERAMLEGLAYTRLAATVSSAMRLVSIGQTRAHGLLASTLQRVPRVVDGIMARGAAPESFTPAIDVATMTHPWVHSRLFRS